MDTKSAVIGAIIFIVLIVGANFVMYAIARGAARSNQKGFLETMSQALNPSSRKKENPMDELRRQMEELEKGKKEDAGKSK
jgi:hypothetical protein